MAEPFAKKTYYALTLDPVHIGTGGYRLGRVDNTITREPGTNLPKIPGSSISGAARAYTAMAVQSSVDSAKVIEKKTDGLVLNLPEYYKMKYQRPVYKFSDPGRSIVETDANGKPVVERYDSCAGKGANEGDGHCGRPDCPVCVSFGFSKKGNSFQGLVQFFDARILFFPVHSMKGPVWITSPSLLAEFKQIVDVKPEKFKAINATPPLQSLNFGWLLLSADDPSTATVDFSFLNTCDVCKVIKDRAFLVPDNLFSRIVNDNLEVRTSVAIDPATGAAEDGALYTYEAIPRATVMWLDVVYNKPGYFRVNGQDILMTRDNTVQKADTAWIEDNVKSGLTYLKDLGVGGMNTRGMGRLKVFMEGGI